MEETEAYKISGIHHLKDLIEALNDWPGVPLDFEDYLAQLRKFFSTKRISISIIQKSATRKNPTINQLWEAESLSSLYRFMYMNSSRSLEDLFATLAKFV